MNDLNLPYNIDALTKIRHDCFHQNFNDPNSLHSSQVHVSQFPFFTFSVCFLFGNNTYTLFTL